MLSWPMIVAATAPWRSPNTGPKLVPLVAVGSAIALMFVISTPATGSQTVCFGVIRGPRRKRHNQRKDQKLHEPTLFHTILLS